VNASFPAKSYAFAVIVWFPIPFQMNSYGKVVSSCAGSVVSST
jgi:hypothetical protein